MKKIYWGPYNPNNNNPLHTSYIEPDPSYKSLVKSRHKDTVFLKCPAVQDFHKNVFVYRSPIDLTLYIRNDGYINVKEHDQKFFDRYIVTRTEKNDKFVSFSLNFQILFYTECEDIVVEQFSASMEDNEFVKNTRVISGRFNIGKWIRPIEVACEVSSFEKEKIIRIKRGDALCYFRFITNEKIGFERTILEQPIYETVDSLTRLKDFSRNNTMVENYMRVKYHLVSLKRKLFGYKCPFRKFWR